MAITNENVCLVVCCPQNELEAYSHTIRKLIEKENVCTYFLTLLSSFDRFTAFFIDLRHFGAMVITNENVFLVVCCPQNGLGGLFAHH